jgi:hypothetical protein
LLLIEVGNASLFTLADRNDVGRRNFLDKALGNGDIADFLHKQPGPFRVETRTDDIIANWGDFYNVDFPTAEDFMPVNTYLFEMHTSATKKLLGTKYTLARAPTDPAQSEVFRGASGIAVYQNPDVFTRAWAVHEIVPVKNADEARSVVQNHLNDLRWKALSLESPAPQLPACAGANDVVLVTEYAPAYVSISADMSCDGMVVLSDTYYPGWYAEVDGHPAKIYEVDLALRGVPVQTGTHSITFRYRPRSVLWGASLTLAGFLGAAVITFWSRKNRRIVQKHHH